MSASKESLLHASNIALIENENLVTVPDYFTQDYVVHLTKKKLTGGHSGIKKILKGLYRAFPDRKVKVEILLEGKDRIAWQRTVTATHSGAYQGFPATNKKITWRDMFVSHFVGGKIAEDWFSTDLAEQLLKSARRPKK